MTKVKTTRSQGRPPSAETLRRREFKASIPDYIKKRPGRQKRVDQANKLYRSLAAWAGVAKKRGITDDYIELVAMEENGVSVDSSLELRYQAAIEHLEKKQASLKTQHRFAGKQSASSRQKNADAWKRIAIELIREISITRQASTKTSMARWVSKRWPRGGVEQPSLTTLRRAIASLNLAVNN